ncbi:hypothetical protein DSL72_000472 [Monilinia vaccinii-corymbosi]|uniref:Uncharacterized protein n=1 Tax=Monilinia vaccinii-corymbosi TaxID=61207 RepID=A0A8A3P4C4_9HELO|nr:hypothetical protein DSL72_000472 [Monilinia vaccinii-corymbosi]
MEMPFTEQEQRFLLAEVIKTSSIPPEKLLVILNDSNVSPNWMMMQVPQGRNLASCINTFESLAGRNPNNLTPQLSGPTLPPFFPGASPGLQNKRKTASELELKGAGPSRKRRTPGQDNVSAQRSIQPKPAANGSPQLISFASPFMGQAPRKRGRPSKLDLKNRQAEEVARGEILSSLDTSKGSIKSNIAGSGDVSLENLMTATTKATMGQDSEPSTINSPGEQTDPSKKKRGRASSLSSDVPKTGEGSFPGPPSQFSEQIQPQEQFGTHQTFDRSMRAQFQPESREAHMHRDNQGQGMHFNVASNIEARQMHVSGEAPKEQQGTQYKSTAIEGKPMEHKDNQ